MNETVSFEEILERDGTLVYTNKGVSMLPLLREGRDLMVIRRKGPERCKRLDVVLFRRPGASGRGAYVLHRVLRVNGDGTYWILGDNCVAGETVREENVLGVLTAVVRNGKTVQTTNWNYRVYSHLWCGCYPVRIALTRARGLLGRAKHKILRILRG